MAQFLLPYLGIRAIIPAASGKKKYEADIHDKSSPEKFFLLLMIDPHFK